MLRHVEHTVPFSTFGEKVHRHIRRVINCLFLLTVCLSVLLLGSTSTAPFLLVSSMMAVTGVLAATFFPLARPRILYFFIAALVICLFIGIAIYQITPATEPGPTIVDDMFESGRVMQVSAVPGDVLLGTLGIGYPLLTFLVGLLVCESRTVARSWLKTIGCFGAAVALFGLLQFLFWPTSLMFGPKQFYLDSLTGSFVNRNSAATFLGVSVLVVAFLAWKSFLRFRSADQDRRSRSAIQLELMSTIAWTVLLFITVVALLLTKSRGGIGATFVSFAALAGALGWISAPKTAYFARRLWQAVASSILAASLVLIFADRAIMRIAAQGVEDLRFCVAPAIFRAARDKWVAGYGIGSFQSVFPRFRDPACGIDGVWNHAHNFFLEGFFDTGIGFVIAAGLSITTLATLFVATAIKSSSTRAYGFLGIAVLFLIVAHSTVDFSLQIPGIAAFCALVIVTLIVHCTVEVSSPRKNQNSKVSSILKHEPAI